MEENFPESHPILMVGGDGDHSYARNSIYQGGVVDAAKALVTEAINDKLDLKILEFDTSNTCRIADLGCSIGPNTFFAVQNIIEAVELKVLHAKNENPSAIEFQVFFNDHYDNDFNTLFKSLPQSRPYFAAGVPGSFYGRLFPKSSLHFVHSSYTLHWLSKVPKEIVHVKEVAIRFRRFVNEVIQAYSVQFKRDMESFLNARAQELVPGGLMAMVIFAVPDGIPLSETPSGVFYDTFGSCLADMAEMGIISEEKVNSFNVPAHHPTPTELEAIIQGNEYFSIERREKLTNPKRHLLGSAKGCTAMTRAIFEGLVKEHFGDEFVDKIFNYFGTKVEENISIIAEKAHNTIDLFILLKRLN